LPVHGFISNSCRLYGKRLRIFCLFFPFFFLVVRVIQSLTAPCEDHTLFFPPFFMSRLEIRFAEFDLCVLFALSRSRPLIIDARPPVHTIASQIPWVFFFLSSLSPAPGPIEAVSCLLFLRSEALLTHLLARATPFCSFRRAPSWLVILGSQTLFFSFPTLSRFSDVDGWNSFPLSFLFPSRVVAFPLSSF